MVLVVLGALLILTAVGLTVLCQGHFSLDAVYSEHVCCGDAGRLVHQEEPQLSVGSVPVVSVRRLHTHEGDT